MQQAAVVRCKRSFISRCHCFNIVSLLLYQPYVITHLYIYGIQRQGLKTTSMINLRKQDWRVRRRRDYLIWVSQEVQCQRLALHMALVQHTVGRPAALMTLHSQLTILPAWSSGYFLESVSNVFVNKQKSDFCFAFVKPSRIMSPVMLQVIIACYLVQKSLHQVNCMIVLSYRICSSNSVPPTVTQAMVQQLRIAITQQACMV